MQINGLELVTSKSTQGFATLTLQFALDKSIDAAATDVQTAISQATGSLPGRPAVAADLLEDQSQRSADHVHRADQRFGHARPALRLREHAGRPAHLHPAGRLAGERLRHEVARSASRPTPRDVGARDLDRRSRGGDQDAARATPARASSTARRGTALLRPQGQLETPEEYSNLIVGSTDGAPVYLRDVAAGQATRSRTSA